MPCDCYMMGNVMIACHSAFAVLVMSYIDKCGVSHAFAATPRSITANRTAKLRHSPYTPASSSSTVSSPFHVV
jgi:hypothetical protein